MLNARNALLDCGEVELADDQEDDGSDLGLRVVQAELSGPRGAPWPGTTA